MIENLAIMFIIGLVSWMLGIVVLYSNNILTKRRAKIGFIFGAIGSILMPVSIFIYFAAK